MKRTITMTLLLATIAIEASQQSKEALQLTPKDGATQQNLGRRRIEAKSGFADCATSGSGGKIVPANLEDRIQELQKALREEREAKETAIAKYEDAKDTAEIAIRNIVNLESALKKPGQSTSEAANAIMCAKFHDHFGIKLPYTDPAKLEKWLAMFRASAARSLCKQLLNPNEVAKLTHAEQGIRTAQTNQGNMSRQAAFDINRSDSVPALLKKASQAIASSITTVYDDNGEGDRGLRYALTILYGQNKFNQENPESGFTMSKEDRKQLSLQMEEEEKNIEDSIAKLFGVLNSTRMIKYLANQNAAALDSIGKAITDALEKSKSSSSETTVGGGIKTDLATAGTGAE